MARYYLPQHVYFCCRGSSVVFLDLRHDEYMLVSGNTAQQLGMLCGVQRAIDGISATDGLRELLDGGLLTTEEGIGRVVAPTQMAAPSESLIDREAPLVADISPGILWSFLVACATAAARLRWQPIERTVQRVHARRTEAGSDQSFDVEHARVLTTAFLQLRALFPVNYRCLFDSLALIEFLARYQLFPTWVFGVRLEPWAAHCWVQCGPVLLNEDVEAAAGYTPVMAI